MPAEIQGEFDFDNDPNDPNNKLPVAHRISLIERDVRSHARSISVIIQRQADQGKKLDALEEFKMSRQIAEAREPERDKALNERLNRIESSISEGLLMLGKQVAEVKGGWSKLLWIIIAAVVPPTLFAVAYAIVTLTKIPLS